jgi:hypothetical protein
MAVLGGWVKEHILVRVLDRYPTLLAEVRAAP